MIAEMEFQNPATGEPTHAQFVAGLLTVTTWGLDEDYGQVEASEEGRAWASDVSGRYPTREAATRALERAGVDIRDSGGWSW